MGTGHVGCRPQPIREHAASDMGPRFARAPILQPSDRRARSLIDFSTKKWMVSDPARFATWAAPSPTETEIPAGIVE